MIYVYDERGMQMWSKPIGPTATLQVYTATSVTVRQGSMIFIYGERGNQLSSRPI